MNRGVLNRTPEQQFGGQAQQYSHYRGDGETHRIEPQILLHEDAARNTQQPPLDVHYQQVTEQLYTTIDDDEEAL